MKKALRDLGVTLLILVLSFCANLMLQHLLGTAVHSVSVSILGVFLTSLYTNGYLWGVLSTLANVFIVNFSFTEPFFAFDFITPSNLAAAFVMLIIAFMTSMFTTKLKYQEKNRAEADREKMRANLLRAISHDLRTPLTTIYGSTSTIIDNYDALSREKQLKLLDEVRSDSQWLIRMVENLLSVTRIDGNPLGIVKSPVVLEELVDAVLQKFHSRCPNQWVVVDIPDEFITVDCDIILLEQVLVNLLENAVFHAKGMDALTLRAKFHQKQVTIAIIDNGCGLSKELLSNPFDGIHVATQPLTDGSRNNMGIGLSVCSTIIRAHGSKLGARNRPEGGAEFYFTLTAEDSENEQ
ncbi:MAG: PAS domain-containing sensor histidine kinase [Ruminococcaceae bacterium]|nr:PAS domain-containing sensor histidine kinase [Oscillospiraceae bacterium]